MKILLPFDDNDASDGVRPASCSQTLHRKEQKRDQRTQTAKDNTKSEKCPERFASGVGAVLDFRIVRKEDDRRDTHGRAECDVMGDQIPPVRSQYVRF